MVPFEGFTPGAAKVWEFLSLSTTSYMVFRSISLSQSQYGVATAGECCNPQDLIGSVAMRQDKLKCVVNS